MVSMGYENMVDLIKTRMDALGINQSELAQKSGLSASQISRILKLESTPSQDAIAAIAHALRVDVEVVVRAAGLLPPEPTLDEQAAAIAYRSSKMTQAQKRAVLAFMNSLEQGEVEPAPVPPANAKLNPAAK
jgi:transcriptional regulator with XRE-family HTH domain